MKLVLHNVRHASLEHSMMKQGEEAVNNAHLVLPPTWEPHLALNAPCKHILRILDPHHAQIVLLGSSQTSTEPYVPNVPLEHSVMTMGPNAFHVIQDFSQMNLHHRVSLDVMPALREK